MSPAWNATWIFQAIQPQPSAPHIGVVRACRPGRSIDPGRAMNDSTLFTTQPTEHAEILERRHIPPYLGTSRHLLQESPHDLARPRLGQFRHEEDALGLSDCADLGGDVRRERG